MEVQSSVVEGQSLCGPRRFRRSDNYHVRSYYTIRCVTLFQENHMKNLHLPRFSIRLLAVVIVTVLAAGLFAATGEVQAAGESVTIISYEVTSCSGGQLHLTADIVRGEADKIAIIMMNYTTFSYSEVWDLGFGGSYSVDLPDFSEGDVLAVYVNLYRDLGWGLWGVASDWVEFECEATGAPITQTEDEDKYVPYTGIHTLSPSSAAPFLSVPNEAGQTPCGVFDVNGWGTKYIGLADFPACSAPVTVLCLNADGQWTADNVKDVNYHPYGEVDFTSSQDGHCAFFED